jgi:sugar phosphate isomerase/epimerase
MKTALALDALDGDLKSTIEIARSAGFSGVAIGVRHPQISGDDFGRTARRDLERFLRSRSMYMACIRAGSGSGGLFDSRSMDSCMAAAADAIELARDLGTRLIALYIGEPPEKVKNASAIESALHELLGNADAAGATMVISSGDVDLLAALLKTFSTGGLMANLDTLKILSAGRTIDDAMKAFAGRVGLWTCADAKINGGMVRPAVLGTGSVGLKEIYITLTEQSFTGPVVVDVRDLSDPVYAAKMAGKYLETLGGS